MGTSLSSTTFLNDLLDFFRDHCLQGLALLVPDSSYLVYLLGILEICMIWSLYFGEVRFQQMITKFMKIAFFFFLVNNWQYLMVDVLFETFKMAGLVASNQTLEVQPSYILDKGIMLTSSVLSSIVQGGGGWSAVLGGLGALVVKTIFCLVIIGAFGFMAIQILIVNIEFYLCASLSVILIPFGLNKYTSFLFEKTVGAMFSFGIKMMFMTFIVGLGITLFTTWNTAIAADAKPQELIQAAFGALTYAFLVWKIPDVAAGAISGSPSLDGGDAINAGRSGASTIASGAAGMARTALSAAGGVSAAANAAKGASSVSRAASFAKNLGVVGVQSAKYAAFGRNYIAARNKGASFIAKNDNKDK